MPSANVTLGVVLVLTALVLFWVFRDARARDANPSLWVVGLALGVLFVPVPSVFLAAGLIVYLFVRPKGKLKRCPHCGAPHLHWLAQCPKCEGPLKKDCHRCMAAVPYEAERCPECGAPLQ